MCKRSLPAVGRPSARSHRPHLPLNGDCPADRARVPLPLSNPTTSPFCFALARVEVTSAQPDPCSAVQGARAADPTPTEPPSPIALAKVFDTETGSDATNRHGCPHLAHYRASATEFRCCAACSSNPTRRARACEQTTDDRTCAHRPFHHRLEGHAEQQRTSRNLGTGRKKGLGGSHRGGRTWQQPG